MGSVRITIGNFFFRYRDGLGPFAFVLGLAMEGIASGNGCGYLDVAARFAGLLVALTGETLRVLTIGYQYIARGGRNRQVYADSLVEAGVFAHCRNPLYLGNLLITIGLALIVNSFWFYLIALPLSVFAYTSIVASEESYLAARFGPSYQHYCRRVNRWLPRWRGFSRSIEGIHFDWKRVLAKEYNTIFLLVPALIGLWLWRDYKTAGSVALPPNAMLTAASAAWLGLYLLTRWSKKNGRLSSE